MAQLVDHVPNTQDAQSLSLQQDRKPSVVAHTYNLRWKQGTEASPGNRVTLRTLGLRPKTLLQ